MFAQNQDNQIGWKLRKSPSLIQVYEKKGTDLDSENPIQWNYQYWFKTVPEITPLKDGYTCIVVPSYAYVKSAKQKTEKNAELKENATNKSIQPLILGGDQFNDLLWIDSKALDSLKKPYYGKVGGTLIFSGLTVPFKYHPAIGTTVSSGTFGDINIGAFIGLRIGFPNFQLGLTPGGFLGVAAIDQNASSNVAVTGSQAEETNSLVYGLGLVFDWQAKFQVGGVVGWDHALGDLGKTYVFQNRAWYSLSLNYKFLNFNNPDQSNK